MCVASIAGLSRQGPEAMGQTGFCENIVRVLNSHIDNALVLEQACRAVDNIGYNSPRNIERFGVAGICDLICRAMLRHLNDPVVFEVVCRAICVLAMNSLNRENFGVSGVCEIITRALPHHYHIESNAEQACAALSSLTILGDEVVIEVGQNRRTTMNLNDNVWKLGQNGICEQLIRCMYNFPGNASITFQGVRTISFLSMNDENRDKLSRIGPKVILFSARGHLENADISRQTCIMIFNMIKGNAFNSKNLGDGGACGYLIEVVRRYNANPLVIGHACLAITSLVPGNSYNQAMRGTKQILLDISNNTNFDEVLRKNAREACSKLQ
jgi:hypothetical protein